MNRESTKKSLIGNFSLFNLARILASGICSGYVRYAPGTVGSLVGWLFFVVTRSSYQLTTAGLVVILSLMIVLAYFAITIVLEDEKEGSKSEDPQWIVIDEWIGVGIALLASNNHQLFEIISALVLFRFFDITKLGPISALEKLPGALGIILDDIMAGICAALTLYLILICLG